MTYITGYSVRKLCLASAIRFNGEALHYGQPEIIPHNRMHVSGRLCTETQQNQLTWANVVVWQYIYSLPEVFPCILDSCCCSTLSNQQNDDKIPYKRELISQHGHGHVRHAWHIDVSAFSAPSPVVTYFNSNIHCQDPTYKCLDVMVCAFGSVSGGGDTGISFRCTTHGTCQSLCSHSSR